jgi:lysophospholipase L1-like esterase
MNRTFLYLAAILLLIGSILCPFERGYGQESALSPFHPWVPFPRIGKDADVWQKAHEKLCESVKKDNPKVLFVGDSITAGWVVWGKPAWDKYFAPLGSSEIGIGGDSIQAVLWRMTHGAVDGIAPSVVVLLIGTNNLPYNTPEDTAKGVTAAVALLKQKLPRAEILVLGILPRVKGGPEVSRKVPLTNAYLSKLTGNHVVFLDVGAVLLDPKGHLLPGMEKDGIHPSAEGYMRLASLIGPAVNKLVKI